MNVQEIILTAVPVIFAITVHEVSHGWVAKQLGDDTADRQGRLTLNPIKHIDPIGTLLVPGLMLFLGGFLFGWARPVPVDWRRLRHPRRDMALVAAAGPGANLLMLILWGLALAAGSELGRSSPGAALIYMGEAGIIINTVLMVLNLFPIPPLDGSCVVTSLLPRNLAILYNRLEPIGLIIILLLLASGMFNALILGPSDFALGLFRSLASGSGVR
jgi:Zn-dependent protease